MRPPVQDLEELLNAQLTEIVNQVLQDVERQATISKKHAMQTVFFANHRDRAFVQPGFHPVDAIWPLPEPA